MIKLISASLVFISFSSFAASDWKVIGETTDCPEKIKILAKEGETFVKAVRNGVEHKLVSQDGSAFKTQDLKTTEFISENQKNVMNGAPVLHFVYPSHVEGNPAKVDISYSGVEHRCRMK